MKPGWAVIGCMGAVMPRKASHLRFGLSVKRVSLNTVFSVTNQGNCVLMSFRGAMTAKLLIFLKGLISDADRKMFRILDKLRLRHPRNVTEWLQHQAHEIEVFYLPAYSPESNPDDYSNCDLKAGVHGKPRVRGHKGLAKRVIGHMRKLHKSPTRLMSHVRHPKSAYAA